jgi:hypothetical protein
LSQLGLRQTPGLHELGPKLLIGEGKRDPLDLTVDDVDEAVLLKIPDFEHAGGPAQGKKLQNSHEAEPAYGSFEKHDQPPSMMALSTNIGRQERST